MRVYNFAAGPATMPEEVLKRAASEMLEFTTSGMSVMEMSHRSKTYLEIYDRVEAKLKSVMGIPDGYKALFLQGGATLQFAAVPMNLISKTGKADYVVTGNFSDKAAKEAAKYGKISIAASSKDKNFSYIPHQDALVLDSEASYFHYCMNNTVYGSLWNYIPETGSVPVVCDMSSCILSEPLDVSKFGVIYAGAQKNMGPAGLTVVIVKEDLAGASIPTTPDVMDYATEIKNDSMLNTPATYGIYLLGLILDWVDELGGLSAMKKRNAEKAGYIYDVIDNNGFYKATIEKAYRSMMNITFFTPNEDLDAKFVKEAAAQGLVNLKGYRTMGGMRASVYNAMPIEGAKKLASFMEEFAKNNK